MISFFLAVVHVFALNVTQANTSVENVEAAFIYQILRYIDWPESNVKAAQEKFKILVVGNEKMFSILSEKLASKKIKSREVEVLTLDRLGKYIPCDVVYFGRVDIEGFKKILKMYSEKPTVILSRNEGYAEAGGMINFFLEKGKLRFEINHSIFLEKNFKVSSQILKLAKVIN